MELYDEYGEIKPQQVRALSFDHKHRIHQTKDLFDGECSLCQEAMKKKIKTYWNDEE